MVLQEYLPPATQDAFLFMVMEFVLLPWQHARQVLAAAAEEPSTSQVASQSSLSDLEGILTSLYVFHILSLRA